MKRLIWIAASILALSAGLARADELTPDAALAHIASVGPKQAGIDYYGKPGWDALVRGIASGNSGWLRVYTALRPSADGAAGEDLGDAIYEAMPARPFDVLPILIANGKLTPQQVCTFTFESSIPSGGISGYLGRLDKSLDPASSNEQRAIAASCRRGIRATRKDFEGRPGY
jgi:hypothetical protein